MRYAVFSDIHSNVFALEAVISDVKSNIPLQTSGTAHADSTKLRDVLQFVVTLYSIFDGQSDRNGLLYGLTHEITPIRIGFPAGGDIGRIDARRHFIDRSLTGLQREIALLGFLRHGKPPFSLKTFDNINPFHSVVQILLFGIAQGA